MSDRPGPQPWPGCDTMGDLWKAYCEAWTAVYRRKEVNPNLIENCRGKEAVEIIRHNMAVVKADYAGELERTDIPLRLRL